MRKIQFILSITFYFILCSCSLINQEVQLSEKVEALFNSSSFNRAIEPYFTEDSISIIVYNNTRRKKSVFTHLERSYFLVDSPKPDTYPLYLSALEILNDSCASRNLIHFIDLKEQTDQQIFEVLYRCNGTIIRFYRINNGNSITVSDSLSMY